MKRVRGGLDMAACMGNRWTVTAAEVERMKAAGTWGKFLDAARDVGECLPGKAPEVIIAFPDLTTEIVDLRPWGGMD